MIPPLITGPQPPYNNPPIEPQFFKPRFYFIEDISLGQTTIVTTEFDHDYVIGQLVRMVIPYGFGARNLSEQTAYVIDIPNLDQVTLNIYSLGIDPFMSNSLFRTKPTINAVGDINNGYISHTGPRLPGRINPGIPGSFKNISPR